MSLDEKTPIPIVKRPPLDSIRARFWRAAYVAALRSGSALPEVRADMALSHHDARFRHEAP